MTTHRVPTGKSNNIPTWEEIKTEMNFCGDCGYWDDEICFAHEIPMSKSAQICLFYIDPELYDEKLKRGVKLDERKTNI